VEDFGRLECEERSSQALTLVPNSPPVNREQGVGMGVKSRMRREKRRELQEAIRALDERKKRMGVRDEGRAVVAQQRTRSKPPNQSKAAAQDIFTKGARLPGAGWAGKRQR
jgi:hypothetical protein